MEIDGQILSPGFFWATTFLAVVLFVLAMRLAAWSRLLDREQLHVFLGTCVGLMVLWSLRTEVFSGLQFHLLGLTTLTLMFGWALGVMGGSLILAGIVLSGQADWYAIPANFLSLVVLPATLTQFALVLIRYWMPHHFFIYIYLNSFLSGGLGLLLSSFLSSGFLVIVGMDSFSTLWDTYLSFFPLIFFPEAVLNGWFMTLLVSYRPHWVSSFRDEDYLLGK